MPRRPASSVAEYLTALATVRASGANVPETSFYPALSNLLNALGDTTRPKVRCILHLQNKGAGIPDGGLFTSDQLRKGDPKPGQKPAVGAIEVKPPTESIDTLVGSEQVQGYVEHYGQALVTNLRQFALLERGPMGAPHIVEEFRLAPSADALWDAARRAGEFGAERGPALEEFLQRVFRSRTTLRDPADVAWFLASYARDARAAIEGKDLHALTVLRQALETELGISFEGEDGEHFFRSSLVQTLFYGVFSAWVLWARTDDARQPDARFRWKQAGWTLRVPMISALFQQVAAPNVLAPLNLVPILDRTEAVLSRVDRAAFFQKFQEEDAVQYFYEPFLESFDPELRKELGVWYTPREIVKYQVARVDQVLRSELKIPLGLADRNVHILDPCCGTGAYLVEVLHTIARTLRDQGGDALVAKRPATGRSDPCLRIRAPAGAIRRVALAVGLLLQRLGAPLGDNPGDRVGVYLTNALTGWDPTAEEPPLPFPELEQEREAAEQVKRETPILVILGNPPYNGFAGVVEHEEERALTEAYKKPKRAPKPQGQGLNDLYVRFFRMAERKIVDGTGRGVICFISNYSWLDGLSFTGMRERFLDVFDRVWIDCLNGDKYKTGKRTPEGEPDPSVFSTEHNREGIQIGTAIALLSRGLSPKSDASVSFRDLWGTEKRATLATDTLRPDGIGYEQVTPVFALGLAFRPLVAASEYVNWPTLQELLPAMSPGVKTSRDLDLVSIDLPPLQAKICLYFDQSASDARVAEVARSLMRDSNRFDSRKTRRALLDLGVASGAFVRFAYQPFDTRWLYYHSATKLLDEKRPELYTWSRVNTWCLTSRQKGERSEEGSPFFVTRDLPDWHLTRPGSACFPLSLPSSGLLGSLQDPNLSGTARTYLANVGGDAHDQNAAPYWHVVAVGHSPKYLTENREALWQDWPRIPLPRQAQALASSAALGRQVAALMDPSSAVVGVSSPPTHPALASLGEISSASKTPLDPESGDLTLTAGWGIRGKGGITMPSRGKVTERPDGNLDIWLNDRAYWANVPKDVWEYTLGGYQVIKKWLSYREMALLGRDLTVDEARYVTEMVRRIAAILALGPKLDENYEAVKADTYPWPRG